MKSRGVYQRQVVLSDINSESRGKGKNRLRVTMTHTGFPRYLQGLRSREIWNRRIPKPPFYA